MKLRDSREAYYSNSKQTSDLVRYLGFAGIAFIWIFRDNSFGHILIPSNLHLPAILIIGALVCDLFQYIAGTIVWGVFSRIKERKEAPADDDFKVAPWLNWPALIFFWGKVLIMISAYLLLIIFLYDRFYT